MLLGNNHIIAGITINRPLQDYVGLFGYTGASCVIGNLGLESVNVTGHDYVGGLVGYHQVRIANLYVTGDISGNNQVGGIAGSNNGSTATIADSFTRVIVVGASIVGGLAGSNEAGASLADCYANGEVIATDHAGGFVGVNTASTGFVSIIDNCYTTVNLTIADSVAGGFVGLNGGSALISDSFAMGNETGLDDEGASIGFFLGEADDLNSLTNSFYNQNAQVENSGTGNAINSDGASPTTWGDLADMSHSVYNSTADIPWTFSASGSSEAHWSIVEGTPHLQAEWNLPWIYGEVASLQFEEEYTATATSGQWNADPAFIDAVRQALGYDASHTLMIGDLAYLTTLTVDSSRISSQGLLGMNNATALVSLALIPTDYSKPCKLTSLSPQLNGLSKLTTLTLQGCGLTDSVLATLPILPALETLDLRYNNLRSVPQKIADLSNYKLSQLFLYGNTIDTSTLGNGLVGHWTFDQSSGLLAIDSVYQGHDGALKVGNNQQQPAWVEGVKGNALQFNAANHQYVVADQLKNLSSASDGSKTTVAFWMKWSGGNSMPISFDSGYNLQIGSTGFGFTSRPRRNCGDTDILNPDKSMDPCNSRLLQWNVSYLQQFKVHNTF